MPHRPVPVKREEFGFPREKSFRLPAPAPRSPSPSPTTMRGRSEPTPEGAAGIAAGARIRPAPPPPAPPGRAAERGPPAAAMRLPGPPQRRAVDRRPEQAQPNVTAACDQRRRRQIGQHVDAQPQAGQREPAEPPAKAAPPPAEQPPRRVAPPDPQDVPGRAGDDAPPRRQPALQRPRLHSSPARRNGSTARPQAKATPIAVDSAVTSVLLQERVEQHGPARR